MHEITLTLFYTGDLWTVVFTCDGSSTIRVSPLLFETLMVI
jgi:hypothetical protein